VHNLIPGLMSNHSATYPNGYLSTAGLMELYGVSAGQDGKLQYTRGTERIPPNWYRRPRSDPYLGLSDLLNMWTEYPETLIMGGNTNGANTFAPIDIGDLTHGVYSTALLLQGSNAACFAFQAVQLLIPDIFNNIEALLASILAEVAQALEEEILALACPKLEALKMASFQKYPGYMISVKRSD
jgi:hypothetical protein